MKIKQISNINIDHKTTKTSLRKEHQEKNK